jgi:hypothetical protein
MPSVWLSEAKCIELFGEEKARDFLRHFGGSELHVPVRPTKNHPIAQVVRIIGMAVLCREYGGCRIDIPNPPRQEGKKARILELVEQGVSTPEIAKQAGVTTRYVRLIRKTMSSQ